MASHIYEVLLHNVSHSDLILSLYNHNAATSQTSSTSPAISNSSNNKIIARPKFSNYREITKAVLESIDVHDIKIASHLKYCRKVVTKNPIQYEVAPVESNEYTPVGFDLCQHPVKVNIAGLRFRRDDKTLISSDSSSASIDGVYFPLLAILLPKWLETIQYRERTDSCKLILYLVTGRGTANDTSALVSDNSTEWSGKLMVKFVQQLYPFIQIIHIHSHTNLFRYDENILFVKRELLPSIDKIRDSLADAISTEKRWKDYFRVTLSFADGSSARVSAINASLKHYRPDYMHFWQLKTFWSELKLCDDDVEWHSHEEISTETALSLQSIKNTVVDDIVSEMKRFMIDFERVRCAGSDFHDLSTFWLRKTKKPVLAVLLVEKDGVRKFYRGTNMEVSMPTGSLCAERNAIGSALAEDLSLCRQDLRMIAVYSPTSLSSTAPTSTSISATEGVPRSMSAEEDVKSVASISHNGTSSQAQESYKPASSLHPTNNLATTSLLCHDSIDQPTTPRDSEYHLSQDSLLSREKKSHLGMSPGLTGAVGHKRKIMNMSLFSVATDLEGADNAQVIFASTTDVASISRVNSSTYILKGESDLGITAIQHGKSDMAGTVATAPVSADTVVDPFTPSPGLPTCKPRSRSNSQTLADSTSTSAPRAGRNATVRSSNRRVLTHSGLSPNPTDAADQAHLNNSMCIPCPLWERGDGEQSGLSALGNGSKRILEPPTIIQVDDSDLNPMKPCGACHEWLKKIAEVNPRFSVM